MSASQIPGSATIYQFPSKAARLGSREPEDRSTRDRKLPHVQYVEFGSGWYHEAAVQDADRTALPRSPKLSS